MVFKTGPGQWFDVICSLVTMPRGFAVFEGCRLSRVPRCSLSMIEDWLREDETAWDREVNEDLLCLQVVFTSWWIIQRLLRTTSYHRERTHACRHAHTHKQTHTQTHGLWEATQLRRKKNEAPSRSDVMRRKNPVQWQPGKWFKKALFSLSVETLLQFWHTHNISVSFLEHSVQVEYPAWN